MIHVVFGIVLTLLFTVFLRFIKNRGMKLNWRNWLPVLIVFGLFLFTFEVILAFIKEGVLQGALVMGSMCLTASVFAAVLLYRFILKPQKSTFPENREE